jgi:hypothetical protein
LQSRNSDKACALPCVSAYVLAYAHAYSRNKEGATSVGADA